MISMSEFKEEDKVVFGVRNMEELKRLQSEIDSWNPKVNECFRGLSTVLNFKDKVVTVSSPSGSEYKVHAVVIVRYDAFNEGDVKKVVADLKDLKMLSQGFGEWDDRMVEIIEKEVKIINKKPNGTCKVQYEDNIWTVSPKCFFKEDMKKDSVQSSVLKSFVKRFTFTFRQHSARSGKKLQCADNKIQNAYSQIIKPATGTNRNTQEPPKHIFVKRDQIIESDDKITNVQESNSNFNDKLVCQICSMINPATYVNCSACFNKIQDVTHEPNYNRSNSFNVSNACQSLNLDRPNIDLSKRSKSLQRPKSRKIPKDSWKCRKCTTINLKECSNCSTCCHDQPRISNSSQVAANDFHQSVVRPRHNTSQSKPYWKCKHCTFWNKPKINNCECCLELKQLYKSGSSGQEEHDEPQEHKSGWKCDECTYFNTFDYSFCEVCGSAGPYFDKWHCDRCTCRNDELNTKCDACDEPNRYLYKCIKCKELAVNIRNLPCGNPVYLICKKCEKEDIYEILDKNNDA